MSIIDYGDYDCTEHSAPPLGLQVSELAHDASPRCLTSVAGVSWVFIRCCGQKGTKDANGVVRSSGSCSGPLTKCHKGKLVLTRTKTRAKWSCCDVTIPVKQLLWEKIENVDTGCRHNFGRVQCPTRAVFEPPHSVSGPKFLRITQVLHKVSSLEFHKLKRSNPLYQNNHFYQIELILYDRSEHEWSERGASYCYGRDVVTRATGWFPTACCDFDVADTVYLIIL